MPDMQAEATVYAEFRARLLAEYPELADDEQALTDTLDGATDLADVCVRLWAWARDDEDRAMAGKARAAEISERAQRLADRAANKKAAVLAAMEAAGRQKIEAPEVTLSIAKKPQGVVITDETIIPLDYWKRRDPVLDKMALKDALKNGQAVPGASLDNGGTRLNVRTK